METLPSLLRSVPYWELETRPAVTVAFMGAGAALRSWNEQVGVLPWDLARFAGARDGAFPVELVIATAVIGAVVTLVGILLALPRRVYERTAR